MLASLTLLIGASCCFAAALEPRGFKLELVQVLFRHGDRTPERMEVYPSARYNESIYEPFGYGQLTNVGKRREYEIGQVLRSRYDEFLGSTYKPREVHAYSTNFDRTKMSLQLVLAGLYPPDELLAWNKGVFWIPFSVSSNRLELDFLQTAITCTVYGKLYGKALRSPKVITKLLKYKDTISHILKSAGYSDMNEVFNIFMIYSFIESHRSMGLPFPEWLSEPQYRDLKEIMAIMYDAMSLTKVMKKITSGPTIRRFLDNIVSQENHLSSNKIYLYSAHDKNVIPFFHAHGLRSLRLATYGLTAIMEKLRGPDGRIYVRLLAWTGEHKQLVTLKLDLCDEMCPLEKYLEIVKPVLPAGTGNECSLVKLDETLLWDIANGEDTDNQIVTRFVNNDRGLC